MFGSKADLEHTIADVFDRDFIMQIDEKYPGFASRLQVLVDRCFETRLEIQVLSLSLERELSDAFDGRNRPSTSTIWQRYPESKGHYLHKMMGCIRWGAIQLGMRESRASVTFQIDADILDFLLVDTTTFDDFASPFRKIESIGSWGLSLDSSDAIFHATNLSIQGISKPPQPAFLLQLSDPLIPTNWSMWIRNWKREVLLRNSWLIIDSTGLQIGRISPIGDFLNSISGCAIYFGDSLPSNLTRLIRSLRPTKSSVEIRFDCWKQALLSISASPHTLDDEALKLASHFQLGESQIQSIMSHVNGAPSPFVHAWTQARTLAKVDTDGIASYWGGRATLADLIVEEQTASKLKELASMFQGRFRAVYRWGLTDKAGHGLGISALFSGSSGTGKTLAAVAIANELNLELLHVDLSRVISKYIGETEKNLSKAFDVAARSGAILFFDEADALFGKRSEVRDSHDRYANQEVSYLLQRMEEHQGVSILATNMDFALDSAFKRRIRIRVHFGFPSNEMRKQLWSRLITVQVDQNDPPNIETLSRLPISGGSIQNIVINASLVAAAESTRGLGMRHIWCMQQKVKLLIEAKTSLDTSQMSLKLM